MSTSKNFYITTTLPYVNSDPHIGFAAEIIRADVIARYKRKNGFRVVFNTGVDEHGLKIYQKAKENNISTQKYCDIYAQKFLNLKKDLSLSYDKFIRTTDKNHVKAAQKIFLKCLENGDIYKKNYKIKYCVGCELEKTESELINNRCSLHPNQEIELINEENYFFRFSAYQKKLLNLYKNNKNFIIPSWRLNEIEKFVEKGLKDFSISRLKEKMPWGVPIPNDNNHVMYVWFDALVNYISTLGWGSDSEDEFNNFWPGIQVAGKDNLRQQAAMWQAMLMSAGIKTSKQILIWGFINSNGQKMSKSLGNVVNPLDLIKKYGIDATRYYLLAEIPSFEDGDFTNEKMNIKYNADLANGLGNLVSRVTNMIEKNNLSLKLDTEIKDKILKEKTNKSIEEFYFNKALKIIWEKIKKNDEFLSKKKPWKLNDKQEIKEILEIISQSIMDIANILDIFMPETSEKIIKHFSQEKIKKISILFPRI